MMQNDISQNSFFAATTLHQVKLKSRIELPESGAHYRHGDGHDTT
jgi:hypothetical protein